MFHRMRAGQPVALTISLLVAASAAADSQTPQDRAMEQVQVLGTPAARFDIPGSAHLITKEDIRLQSYDDINRILRKVPGVYLREEDGFGLFPNISLRGVDTSRSAKITLMEDGVLTAPAPYASPAAYYSPTAGRMSSLEVLKGSSQVKYGPHVTGGVLNYLSTTIPDERQAYVKAMYGSQDEMRVHAWLGDTLETANGRFGYVIENYYRSTDGFKTIDAAPGFAGSDNTGFTNIEPSVKLSWEPATSRYQRFEAKVGYTNMEADETYLGLAEADFSADPNRRYAASRFDNIDTEHYRSYLRWYIEPTSDTSLSITGYYNRFARDWFKLHDLRSVGTAGNLSLSAALAGAGAGQGLACLQGALDCTLRVRHNDRAYESYGVQINGTWDIELGAFSHSLAAGVRYHEDYEDREQREELFTQDVTGFITDRIFTPTGSAGDRRDSADAIAVYFQDSIRWGNWTFVPGVRFEAVDLARNDRTSNRRSDADVNMLGGGIGVSYQLSEEWMLFGGAHRGFSPPSPGGAINDGLQEETSWAFEAGMRYASNDGAVLAELVGFFTQFDDLIVVDNIGGTGTGDTQNFGEVESMGIEFSGTFDAAARRNAGFSLPLFLTFTYTDAEQQNDAASTDPESIFSFGARGNAVPYIPEITLSMGAGFHTARFGGELVASYTDETFASANNVFAPLNGLGDPDARFGTTDDFWTLDISGYYQVTPKVRVLGGVQNLLDEEYLVSRQPHGPRPGQNRFAYVGVEFDLNM
jgi:Fe(3+) dicitrate transport protein